MAVTDPHTSSPPAVTERGRAAARSLVTVHDGLRDELRQVTRLVDEVVTGRVDIAGARGDLQRLALRRHDWTTGAYCSAHCLAVAQHHYGEDHEIFPLLRRARPDLDAVLTRLQDEHLVVHDLLERLDGALVALATGDAEGRDRLRRTLAEFSEVLLAHLAYEEQHLLDPMAQVFS